MNHGTTTCAARFAMLSAMVFLAVLAAGAAAGDCEYQSGAAVDRVDALGETQNLLNSIQGVCDPNHDKKDDRAELFHDKLEIFKKSADRDAGKIKDDGKPTPGATVGEVTDLQRDFQGAIDAFKEYSKTHLEPVLGFLQKESTDGLPPEHLDPIKGIKLEITNFTAYVPTYIQKLEYARAEFVVGMKKDDAKRTVDNLEDTLKFVEKSRDILRKQMEELARQIQKVSENTSDLEKSCGAIIADERRHREDEARIARAEATITQLQQQIAAMSAARSAVSTVRTGDPDDENAAPVGGQTPSDTATPPGTGGSWANLYAFMSTVDTKYVVKPNDCLWNIAKAHCAEWGCDPCTGGCIQTVLVPRLQRHIIRIGPKHSGSIWPGDLIDMDAMKAEQ